MTSAGEKDSKSESDISCIAEKKDTKNKKESKQTEDGGKDEIEEALICIICQEIMHDCIR